MAQPQPKPEKTTTGRAQPPVPRGFMFWWLMSLALLIWYVTGLWTRSQPKAAIPYSLFLTQVQQNNVSQVHIAGDVIEGKFVKQIVWPQPESPTETSSKPIQAPSSSPSGVTGQAATGYSEFTTTFPATVGDPSAMPLLIAHHVVVARRPR